MVENPDHDREESPAARRSPRRTCERRQKKAGSNGPKRAGEMLPRGCAGSFGGFSGGSIHEAA